MKIFAAHHSQPPNESIIAMNQHQDKIIKIVAYVPHYQPKVLISEEMSKDFCKLIKYISFHSTKTGRKKQ